MQHYDSSITVLVADKEHAYERTQAVYYRRTSLVGSQEKNELLIKVDFRPCKQHRAVCRLSSKQWEMEETKAVAHWRYGASISKFSFLLCNTQGIQKSDSLWCSLENLSEISSSEFLLNLETKKYQEEHDCEHCTHFWSAPRGFPVVDLQTTS